MEVIALLTVYANGWEYAQEDRVGKAIQMAISRGAILDDFDNPVKALTDGIGQVPIGEGDDVIEVLSHRANEAAQ